jgi:hypothetical protein
MLNVRRLAALDMWGSAGTMRRRRIIRTEFMLGAIGCTSRGLLAVVEGSGWWVVVGIWLIGAGVNYVPPGTACAVTLTAWRAGGELAGIDVRSELRHAGLQQFWIAVPLAVAVFAVVRP